MSETMTEAPRTKAQDAADRMVAAFEGCTTAQEVMLTIDRARVGIDLLAERDEVSWKRVTDARAAAYQRLVSPPPDMGASSE